jgi:hypothetical protein
MTTENISYDSELYDTEDQGCLHKARSEAKETSRT